MKNIRVNKIDSRLNGVEPELTHEGYWIYKDVKIARTGLFDWGVSELKQDGILKTFPDYKLNKVVQLMRPVDSFTPEVILSANSKSITDGHPRDGLVNPDNYKRHEEGQLTNVRFDGEYLIADLIIKARSLIDKIKRGVREVSIGYEYAQPVNFVKDLHYVALEYIISINHVAFVHKGRAGPVCRVNNQYNLRGNKMIEDELLEQLKESNRLNSALSARLNESEKKKEEEEKDRKNKEMEEDKKKKESEEKERENSKKEMDDRENSLKEKECAIAKKEEEMKGRENDVFMNPADLEAFVERMPYDKLMLWYEGEQKSGRDKTAPLAKFVAKVMSTRKNEEEAAGTRKNLFSSSVDVAGLVPAATAPKKKYSSLTPGLFK